MITEPAPTISADEQARPAGAHQRVTSSALEEPSARSQEALHSARDFVRATREYVYFRAVDRLLILRPNRVHHLNASAALLLERLYGPDDGDAEATVSYVAQHYGQPRARVAADLVALIGTLSKLLNQEHEGLDVRYAPFRSHELYYPVLSEIALTYRCQLRCRFCYAASPSYDPSACGYEMSTAEVKRVIDTIHGEAQVPTISFTGGEPTLRPDLPELIAYASALGMRTNLITNGIRSASQDFVARLKEAGLASAQVSLEGPDAAIHDAIVGVPGAFEKTTRGFRNLRAAGIHTHTNTTINRGNLGQIFELIAFVKSELESERMSMNMEIRTGCAIEGGSLDELLSYTEIAPWLTKIAAEARRVGIKFFWYSPTPYCLFDPVAHDLGSKSCACGDGFLSINPSGDVLPCSSFSSGMGNLLRQSFDEVWSSLRARYWRKKTFLPPLCRGCEKAEVCGGGCPLYWDACGSFGELERATGRHNGGAQLLVWKAKRKLLGRNRAISEGKSR